MQNHAGEKPSQSAERRTQPVLPVPGGGGDLHVASLPGSEAHQAAEGVSDLLVPWEPRLAGRA